MVTSLRLRAINKGLITLAEEGFREEVSGFLDYLWETRPDILEELKGNLVLSLIVILKLGILKKFQGRS